MPDRDGRRAVSTRERQVSDYLNDGKSEQEIADALGISVATVKTHRYRAARRDKLQPRLPRRQREVVSCLALGLTVDEVADHLGIARGTVVQHRSLAALTLSVRSTIELTHYAIDQGWVEAGDALSPERMDAALRRIARQAGGSLTG